MIEKNYAKQESVEGIIKIKKYLKLMRVHHYIKNILIFLPLIYGGKLSDSQLVYQAICGFLSFSLIASVIYIINDINDVEKDRLHVTKCKRPIASGEVSVTEAWCLVGVIVTLGIAFQYLSSGVRSISWLFIATYFVLNLMYSKGLKNVPIVDIAILASGFLLRILYGSAVTGIETSNWLYLTILAISFYLGLGKRRNELQDKGEQTREVLKHYNYSFLDKNMYTCLSLAIVFYALWCVDPTTIARYSNGAIVWTVPLVILIAMKYSLNLESDSDGDPVEVILRDKVLLLLLFIYGMTTMALIYI